MTHAFPTRLWRAWCILFLYGPAYLRRIRLGFSLVKFCKVQLLNSFFREISFPEFPKYSWNLQMLIIFEKFKHWKILLKNSWKIGSSFGRWSWEIGTPLTRWHAKLNNWHIFGRLACLLVSFLAKIRSWHVLSIWERRPRWHVV